MPESRRKFLSRTAAGIVGAAAVSQAAANAQTPSTIPQTPLTAGTPPAFARPGRYRARAGVRRVTRAAAGILKERIRRRFPMKEERKGRPAALDW